METNKVKINLIKFKLQKLQQRQKNWVEDLTYSYTLYLKKP